MLNIAQAYYDTYLQPSIGNPPCKPLKDVFVTIKCREDQSKSSYIKSLSVVILIIIFIIQY